ncbi:motility associated factor glycosyltransferase family protein [Anaerocolumna sp. MB42-C2]|uniref:motility associated factor glycosyltransferase family protein n=1 Tax=Anaerocolumna sp. MB42-C2 TaxID=3070997 RepID=UPI0027E20ED8|nr:6-hydroxymethylpterin diphosphokinase MptE-like protein [Anaerocolumna sp. MB42-C2]WMJ90226.1 DUF115 domain-containing protein [Anaerocolumna sp. MB42-C2]
MNIYEQNLNEIRANMPKLYEDITKAEQENLERRLVTQIETLETKEDQTSLIIKIEGKKYRLNSSYYPIKEARIWAEQYNYDNLGIVVSMFGFGNGSFVRELLKHLEDGAKVIIYEPVKEIFMFVLHQYDLSDIWKNCNISFFVGEENKLNFTNAIDANTHWTNVYSQIICKHPQYDKAFLNRYRDFLIIIQENNERTFINRNTESYFGKSIVHNTISNLFCIKDANTVLEYLGKLPQDIPAIIVSAGPSLDKNIDELKRAKGKAIIVATDTALRHLFNHDIEPDFAVTIDAKKPAEYFSNPRCKDVPLFCKVEANHTILANHTSRKILFSCHPYLNKIYANFGKLISYYAAGGSVATGAFSICAALKFKRIVLIGQDLAYGNGVTHAGGEISSVRNEEEGIRFIEDNDGNPIKTRHDWYIYLKWFENSIELVPDIDVINATEGGAKIKGAKVMTLSDVIDQYCNKEVNCKDIVNSIEPTLSEDNLVQVKSILENSRNDLDKIINKSNKAISLCNKIIKACKSNMFDTAECRRMVRQVTNINDFIEGTLVYNLIDTYISDEASKKLAGIYLFSKDQDEDLVNTFNRTKAMHELIRTGAREMKPMLEEELKKFW